VESGVLRGRTHASRRARRAARGVAPHLPPERRLRGRALLLEHRHPRGLRLLRLLRCAQLGGAPLRARLQVAQRRFRLRVRPGDRAQLRL
jgi:hypothetical protein